eukprot:47564-Amphidinium_carterae.1
MDFEDKYTTNIRQRKRLELIPTWDDEEPKICVMHKGELVPIFPLSVKNSIPYYSRLQFTKVRRAYQLWRTGMRAFPPSFWEEDVNVTVAMSVLFVTCVNKVLPTLPSDD